MTASLLTEGFIGGSTSDSTPPIVSAISPTPNTTPGTGGGFALNYPTAALTPIVVQATDQDGPTDVKFVSIVVLFLDGTIETAMAGGSFLGKYTAGSFQSSVANGFQFSLLRAGGWPGATQASNLSVGVTVTAVDGGGNITAGTFYWELPPQGQLEPTFVAPIAAAGTVDHVAQALSRITYQFRA